MVVMAGLSTTACSESSCPSTHVSCGTLWIQESRQQPSLASEPQRVCFVPLAGNVTILPATAPWPPFSSSSTQCRLLLSTILQGAWRHSCIFVWHGIKDFASGHPAHIVTFVQHASLHTGPVIVQIRQQIRSIDQPSPRAHLASPPAFLPPDVNNHLIYVAP